MPRIGAINARCSRCTPALPLTFACMTVFAVSGGALWVLGLNYEGLSGAAASKIHPSTYMLFALLGWTLLASGDPVAGIARLARLRPAAVFLFVAAAVMLVHIAVRGAPGMAGDIDTYMAATIAVLLLAQADEAALRRIEISIHVLMSVNALMGLGEFAADQRIFPYRFDGEIFSNDFRSTALQGHPLANASITACYVLTLIGNGRFSLNPWLRAPLIALQFAALVAFGGRTGLVLALALGAAQAALRLRGFLRRGRVPLPAAALAVLILTLAPLAVGAMVAGGFFDQLAERFTSDNGSAYARVLMFDLFERLSTADLLVGPDAAYMDSIRRVAGLELGIENPVIRTIFYQGLVMTALLTAAVTLYLREIARVCAPGVALPMLCFVLLLNTSESIGGKTALLTKFSVMILCLYRAERLPQGSGMARPSAETTAGSRARVASSIMPKPSNRFQKAQAKPLASATPRTSRI